MNNKNNSGKLIKINKADVIAANVCKNVIRELILHSDKFNVSAVKFNTLVKAYYALESFPVKKITGYIDISANTHLPGGGLDYSSFTIGEDYFEIYTGFISYEGGVCDDSSWEKIYSSKDNDHKNSFLKAIECWAESFLLHLDENPSRSLLIVDRSQLDEKNPVQAEVNQNIEITSNKYAAKNYFEYEEAPF
ncbi:MAG: hypothetical protein IT280_02870 [Ignavibacteria bacterium]|nr:hypothetical protein [Ignavibacteria bacterium]